MDGKIGSTKNLTSSSEPGAPPDLISSNSKMDANSFKQPQLNTNISDSNKQAIDPQLQAHLSSLDSKVKSSINQMMKEQRSLSVGSLPGNLKSHILKTMQYEHLQKGVEPAVNLPSEGGVNSEGLNKIRELPEEHEKVPKLPKAHTQ